MKCKIFLFTIFVMLISCTGRQNLGNPSDIDADSDTACVIEANVDSLDLQTNLYHKDEGKVLADLNFFISEKDFDKNADKYLQNLGDAPFHKIGSFEFGKPTGYFMNDSLYYVICKGYLCESTDYDRELSCQYDDLVRIYSNKYGKPTYVPSFPERDKVEESSSYYLVDWELGQREIQVSVHYSDYRYWIELRISRKDFTIRNAQRYEQEHKDQNNPEDYI